MISNSQFTNILLLVGVGFLVYYLVMPSQTTENMENNDTMVEETQVMEEQPTEPEMTQEQPTEETPVPQLDTSDFTGMTGDETGANLDNAFMGAVPPSTTVDQVDFNRNNVTEYDSSQFLPQEVQDEWFDTDFTKAKYTLNDDKMINTNRYVIGVNTVGQSLKNPAYDIRGTIPNPKYTVSPWNNSTYEPDNNLKPLC